MVGVDIGIDVGADDGVDVGADDGADVGVDDGADVGVDDGVDVGVDDGVDDGEDDGVGHSYSRMNAALRFCAKGQLAPLSSDEKTKGGPAPSGPPVDEAQETSSPDPWSNSHANQYRPGVLSTIGAEKVTVMSNPISPPNATSPVGVVLQFVVISCWTSPLSIGAMDPSSL